MNIRYASFVTAVLFFLSLCAYAQNDSVLFPVVKNGRVGYIDRTGVLRIQPQFAHGWKFSEGLACVVQMNGQTGFIDATGRLVIPAKFDSSYGCFNEFHDGLSAVSIGSSWVKRHGKLVQTGEWGFTNKRGTFKVLKNVGFVSDFREGLAFFHKGNLTGYMDRNFNIVIKPRFKSAGNFYFGRARAEDSDGKEYYIDKTGKKLFPNWNGGEFQDSRAFFEKNGKYGFIDLNGKIIIPAKFDNATHFGEGLAGVRVGEKWGFVDPSGEMVIQPQFDEVGVFSEGLVSVAINGKWGFIDPTGRIVITPQFDKWTYYFENGLCEVHVGDKIGYIDKEGRFVWPLTN